ncbi:MAG: hypothetical protein M3O94_09695, partial [Actinomycetota bacterium]|nr:hypothetical protein [Actinomycetota bacterium]
AARSESSYGAHLGVNPDNEWMFRNVLTGVSVLSPTDVWTIGNRGTGSGDYRPFVRHFDGGGWTTVGDIDLPGDEYPTSIFASFDDDVWVTQSEPGTSAPLVQHWDGTSWRQQDIAGIGSDTRLFQVWAGSPTEVWAVGTAFEGSKRHPLIEHYDGTHWEETPTPDLDAGVLFGVRGTSRSDVWAVGYYGQQGRQALMLHWDGVSWRAKGRFGQPGSAWFEGVDVVSPTDAWAVGRFDPQDGSTRGLLMHWNGKHWSDAYTEAFHDFQNVFGVVAIAADDAWVVGQNWDDRARSAHWDGRAWKLVPVRNPGSQDNALFAVSADATDDVWAVGGFWNDTPHRMTQHWNGTAWSR